jgi:hypothetical protein
MREDVSMPLDYGPFPLEIVKTLYADLTQRGYEPSWSRSTMNHSAEWYFTIHQLGRDTSVFRIQENREPPKSIIAQAFKTGIPTGVYEDVCDILTVNGFSQTSEGKFELKSKVGHMKFTAKLLRIAKRVSITPEMVGLMGKIQEKELRPVDIGKIPYASKTLKALMGKDLVKLDPKTYVYSLTHRGENLLSLTPRWSGDTSDSFGRRIQVWNVVDNGSSFAQFSDKAREHQVEQRIDLPAEKDRTTFFD